MLRASTTLAIFVAMMFVLACEPEKGHEAISSGSNPAGKINSRLNDDHSNPGQPQFGADLDPASSDFGVIYLNHIDRSFAPFLATLASDAQEWSAFFRVYQQDLWLENSAIPSMLGSYSFGGSTVQFVPRYPLTEGLTYRAVFDSQAFSIQFEVSKGENRNTNDAIIMDTLFTVPHQENIALTNVRQVYPGSAILPDNLLKFYIEFSSSMSEGQAYENLSLIDLTTNAPVAAPFVIMEPELWDPERKRFTLLFDPGRIKRSVSLNLELGAPLQIGHSYQLIISKNWHNAAGEPLTHDFVKQFEVTHSDRDMPRIENWQTNSPAAASQDRLEIQFTEPLDHALLQRVIDIYDSRGQQIEGNIEIGAEEMQWFFSPVKPWQEGRYEIRVRSILEDVAGNTLRSLFDVDLQTAPASEVREASTFKMLTFDVLPTSHADLRPDA